ncbi:hypothetical protein [Bacillus sp. 1P06AnD]|uniref:hypothetical protein n=1 Tax=Bacillus sp. 1P06AnD TaxID=3132208 RepID=UPI0039A229EB
MDNETANNLLKQLKSKEIHEVIVSKEDFLTFREQLVKREDFKHFAGNAKHGGITVYTYHDVARS